MAYTPQGDEAPERSYVSSMFDDDSRYSGNLFVDTGLVTPMKSLWPVPGTRLKQFDSVMRVLPGKRDDGRWSAFRTGTGKGEYGRWMYSSWAARAIGEPAITFFLCSDKDTLVHGYDPRQHPVYILYNAIYWAVDGGNSHVKAHWAPMVNSRQRKVIKKPGPMFLVQCLIYGRGDKIYDPPMGTDDGEKVVVFDLASDGGKTLRALLDQRKGRDEYEATGGPGNFADYYKYGDITDFATGKFVQIFPAGHNPNREAAGPAASGPRRSLSRATLAESRNRAQKAFEGGTEKIGYEVLILDEYQADQQVWTPNIEPDLAASLEEKIHSWPDIIKVPDHKTAASYLWSRMRFGGELKLDVLLYAWQDHPDWLPAKDSDVWAEWVNRRQVASGYNPEAGDDADDGGGSVAPPQYDQSVDRRPRYRATDAGERSEDQPRSTHRPVETQVAAPDDTEPPPQRAPRVVTQPEAVISDTHPLKGHVARPKPNTAAADAISGGRAASDVVAGAAHFRPSTAVTNDDKDEPLVSDKAGGFATPPAAATPTAGNRKDPRDILAHARSKFPDSA